MHPILTDDGTAVIAKNFDREIWTENQKRPNANGSPNLHVPQVRCNQRRDDEEQVSQSTSWPHCSLDTSYSNVV